MNTQTERQMSFPEHTDQSLPRIFFKRCPQISRRNCIPGAVVIDLKYVKTYLSGKNKKELTAIILKYYNQCPRNKALLDVLVDPLYESKIFENAKRNIIHVFYPEKGIGKVRFRKIRSIIGEYISIPGNDLRTAELYLTAVEQSVRFVTDNGNMNVSYYNSTVNLYRKFLIIISANGLQKEFQIRCEKIYNDIKISDLGFFDKITLMNNMYLKYRAWM
ncbi:MAG: DUF6155 family protein [Treponema sp.]|nr:DUF6155 family protein [Treponema sp.]